MAGEDVVPEEGEGPVQAEGKLLRRIHRKHVTFAARLEVLRIAFKPNSADVDGISLYRERFTGIAALVAAARVPEDVYVARFDASELLALGVSLVPTPNDLPGHVSVPELSLDHCAADPAGTEQLQRDLAKLAGVRIVHTRRVG